MTTMSLPSPQDVEKAVSGNKTDVGRQLLWQALQYGTSSTVEEASQNQTAQFLSLLLDSTATAAFCEEHLADVFWLVSCAHVGSAESAEDPSVANSQASLAALASILKALLVVKEKENGKDGDDKPEESPEPSSSPRMRLIVQLQSHLDPYLLEASGLVASEKELMKKMRMLNTKNYRQQKFNLLQEESEGYSKVLDALWRRDYSHLKAIMGTFPLDPNRILDLAVDVLVERRRRRKANKQQRGPPKADDDSDLEPSLEWLKQFSLEKLPPLIAFKLKQEENLPPASSTTQHVLSVIAYLAANDILDVAHMARYMEPIDEVLGQTYRLYQTLERSRVRSVGRVRLGGGSASSKREEEREAANQAKLQQWLQQLESMHRIQLLNILLQDRQWKLSQTLVGSEEALTQLLTLFRPLGSAVCDIVQKQIQPLVQKHVVVPPMVGEDKDEQDNKEADTTSAGATSSQVVDMVSGPLLCTLDSGCIVSRPVLYCVLCRLLRVLLLRENGIFVSGAEAVVAQEDPEEIIPTATFYKFVQGFLLPSLSLFAANPALSMEMWSILKLFPYTTRYQLYRDWRGTGLERAGLQMFGEKKKPLVLVESEMHAGKDARYVLKRLSKDTIRESCRQVAKVTHSNPLVMFTTVLNQIESYDNLVGVMVDAVRFVTPLGLDVLGFCMLSRLCGSSGSDNNASDRSRSKEGGINVALWLQSIESFIGAFYERCPYVEFRGIVCYIMRRLRDGHVTELGVLRSLLKATGGWSFADYSPAGSLSAAQLDGRAGSTLLQRETMTFGVVGCFNHRSSHKLRLVLQGDDMGVSLLILLAQVRSRIIFDDGGGRPKPVKLIGSLFDATQVAMSILLDFLTKSSDEVEQPPESANKKPDGERSAEILKYARSLPSLVDLMKIYGIDVASAWMLCRPLLRAATLPDSDAMEVDGKGNDPVKAFAVTDKSRTDYKALVQPPATWDDISPEFYELFYTCNLYDLFCPENSYTTAISRLAMDIERLKQQKERGMSTLQVSLQPGGGGVSHSDTNREVERLKQVSSSLSAQLPRHKKHVESIHEMIQASKPDTLYFNRKQVSVSSVNAFISKCIFPRCMQGPDDAMYCARFVALLHQGETPGFSTLHYFDELVSVLSSSLFGVTEGEAANLSILLHETWKSISRWRYDENAYDEEVMGKPGCFMVNPMEEESIDDNSMSEENIFPVSFEQYKALFVKWHARLGAAALGCLKSTEYMHTRASLIVLSRIVEVFPTRPNLGNKLFEVLEPLKSEGNSALPDIRSAAQAYIMQLNKARTDGVWKEEDAAVVEARVKAEKKAADLRKKKAEDRFAELKRESDKITSEMGFDDRRDRFGARDRDRRGRPMDDRDFHRGSHPHDRRSPTPLNASAPTFEPPSRVVAGGTTMERGGDRRGGSAPIRDAPRGREPSDRRRDTEVRGARDPGTLLGSLGRAETHAASAPRPPRAPAELSRSGGRGAEDDRGLGDRWEGGRGGRSRGKRGRSSSPDGDRDRDRDRGGRDEHPSKRQRTDPTSSQRSPGGRRSRR